MKTFTSGSSITVQAALDAGCTFYAGYPITPASKIMEDFASIAIENKKIKFLQSEDEIAAIHHVMGASISGAKAMSATSGPGFSLMQEGLGLAFSCSIPLVVINVMRHGPSTGMPTKPSQGDLLQTQFGTHGDYKSIVFYPNSIQNIYQCIKLAFNASEESSSPVIVLLDATLTNLYETYDANQDHTSNLTHKLKFAKGTRHLSGLICDENGIPKTDNADVAQAWYAKTFENFDKVASSYDLFEYKEQTSDTLLVSLGSLSRLIPESKNYDKFVPLTIFPVSKTLKDLSKNYKKIIVAEMNHGQYSYALRSELKREVETISFIGGLPKPEEIQKHIALSTDHRTQSTKHGTQNTDHGA